MRALGLGWFILLLPSSFCHSPVKTIASLLEVKYCYQQHNQLADHVRYSVTPLVCALLGERYAALHSTGTHMLQKDHPTPPTI